jgi:NAD(P)-dependent dehydrogenase (short-subunit alcohol dehydrogenase family)
MSVRKLLDLSGKTALVTGGSRGLGLQIAEALGEMGAKLAITARKKDELDQAASRLEKLDVAVSVHVCDIGKREAIAPLAEEVLTKFGRVDILVNNAGQAKSAPLARTDLAHWQDMLAVNLTGTFLCTREVIAEMTRRGSGRIVNVASTAGLLGYAYVSAYCAAKHGVIGLTRAAALEAAKSGVTVNAVCPGYTETEIVQEAVANIVAKTGKSEAEARAALVARNPQGRMIQPDEVADAVLWLCLPGSGSITGQAIAIAGGEVM